MKVLMVTPYLPYPPYSGGQTRSFNLVKHLAAKCELTLFSFMLPDQNISQIKELKKYCHKVLTVERGKTWQWRKIFFTGRSFYPLLVANYFSPQMRQAIIDEIRRQKYDLIHVECFYLMPNIPPTDIPVILVDQTIEFAVYQHYEKTLPWWLFLLKPFLLLDVAKIKYWELFFWKKADHLVAVSRNDQELMERLAGRKVELVPNGVDEKMLHPHHYSKYRQPTILYGIANFKWMQNKEGAVNLLKYVWPKIKKRVPSARLYIAGRHSADFLQKHRDLVTETEDVLVGEVKDTAAVYRQSWVLVAPMKSGGGSRTKFFEAMACGLPIITTPEGIEGIEARNNNQVIIRHTYRGLIKETVKLLKDKKRRDKIGQNALKLVKEKYSWRISAEKLLDIYEKAIRKS